MQTPELPMKILLHLLVREWPQSMRGCNPSLFCLDFCRNVSNGGLRKTGKSAGQLMIGPSLVDCDKDQRHVVLPHDIS